MKSSETALCRMDSAQETRGDFGKHCRRHHPGIVLCDARQSWERNLERKLVVEDMEQLKIQVRPDGGGAA